jgi:trigger factor
MIPGFEQNLVGMREGEEKSFTVTFPDDYGETELAGTNVDFHVELRELRERRPPPLDDAFAQSVGAFADVAALRADIARRLHRNSLDRARHAFADRVIEYAVANATTTLPDLLVDREVDVMLDELQVRLAEQGIGYEDYQRVTERDEAKLREEYRSGAEHRVKVLLVLGAIADTEGVEVPDSAVEAEIERGRRSNRDNPRLVEYLASPRGRAYVRSTLRRSQTVELLIDRWIAAHQEFRDVQHVEDQAHDHDRVDAVDPVMADAEMEAEEAQVADELVALAASGSTERTSDGGAGA